MIPILIKSTSVGWGITKGKLYLVRKILEPSKFHGKAMVIRNDFGNEIVVTEKQCYYVNEKDWIIINNWYFLLWFFVAIITIITFICVFSALAILTSELITPPIP